MKRILIFLILILSISTCFAHHNLQSYHQHQWYGLSESESKWEVSDSEYYLDREYRMFKESSFRLNKTWKVTIPKEVETYRIFQKPKNIDEKFTLKFNKKEVNYENATTPNVLYSVLQDGFISFK